jgi:hypothetical protein
MLRGELREKRFLAHLAARQMSLTECCLQCMIWKWTHGVMALRAMPFSQRRSFFWCWALNSGPPTWQAGALLLFFFLFILLFICAYKAWFISPTCPHPLPYHPLRPLPLPHTQYPAETILPLSLILLKREYKQ